MDDTRSAVRATATALRDRLSTASDRLDAAALADRWWAVTVVVLAATAQAYAVYRTLAHLPPGVRPVLKDSIIFEYIGWYLSTGARLYVDIWEVKPPLSFELLAVLGVVSGSDMALYHTLVLLFSCLLVVAGALAVAGIVHEVTGDGLAAVAGGLFLFALPQFFWRGIIGFKAKYLVIAVGLAALYFALRERPVLAGAFAACAVWTWQLAVVFPVVALVTLAGETRDAGAAPTAGPLGRGRRGFDRDAIARFVAAAAAVSALVLLPVLAWGAFEAMVTEVVLTPLLTTEQFAFKDRLQFVVRMHGRTLPFALVGVLGLAASALPRYRRGLPMAVTAGWFAFTMLYLDFDNRPDLFPWYALVAVGVGFAVGWGRAAETPALGVDARRLLAAALLVFSALSVATMGGYGIGRQGLTSPETYDTATELDPEMTGSGMNKTHRQYLFWNAVPPETCRVFGGVTQFRLVKQMGIAEGEPWYEAPCGDVEPAWRAFRSKYL